MVVQSERANAAGILSLALLFTVACDGSLTAASVGIQPQSATLGPDATERFHATVIGALDAGVTWSVSEGSLGGTIDDAGVYTAPSSSGTFHVVVESVENPHDTATATVTVVADAPIAVIVEPQAASAFAMQTVTFFAAVTNAANTAVTWSVQEGSSGGAVSSDGVYTAPATAGTYHVVATSVADSSKSSAAPVTVLIPTAPVSISISPGTASLYTGASQTFICTVANAANTACNWSVQEGAGGGSITSAGLYTAPATAGTWHVVATSVADTSKSATATVTVAVPPPVSVAISPTSTTLAPGARETFTCTVTNATNTACTWSVQEAASGGSITSTGVYTAPMTAGGYHVVATSVADTSKSATAAVTVSLPVTVTISPTTAALLATAAATFTAAVKNSANTAVTWSVKEGASGGSVTSAGIYTAPATAGSWHVVATSVADTSKSAAATVTVTLPVGPVAVAISPKTASLSTGANQTFSAAVTNTSNTAVSWSVQEGAAGGSVTSAGVYTAPASATTAHVIATSQADATKSDTATVTVVAAPTTGVWTNVTPSGMGGGATDVVVDPSRPSNLYASANHGGVWASTNYGVTWTKVSTGSNGSILDGGVPQGAAIAINPNNPSGPPVLYISCSVTCAHTGLWVSIDGGVDWTISSPANTQTDPTFMNDVYGVAVDPTNANHVVVGFHGVLGLSETLNALAATPAWRTIPTAGAAQGQSIFPFFIHPSPAEAAAGASISTTWLTQAQWDSGEGIWRTHDSGATWTHVVPLDHPHGNSQLVDLGGGLLYAAGYPQTTVAQGIWKSTDYGVTWANVYSSAPEGGIVATPTRLYSSNGFAGAANPNLVTALRSADTTWAGQTAPSGMGDGWKRVSVTFDGAHYILVGGFWSSGLWRYVE